MMQREKNLLVLLAYLCSLHFVSVSMDTELATVPVQDTSILNQDEDVPDCASATCDNHNSPRTTTTVDGVTTFSSKAGVTTSETAVSVTTFSTKAGVATFEPTFQILTLRTEARPFTYSFQLEYTSHSEVLVQVAEKTFSGFVSILYESNFRNTFVDGHGVVSATSATPRYEVLFESSDRIWQSKVFINVKNTTQLRLKQLLLNTNIGNQIVFNKGETVEIKVQTAKRNERRHPFDKGGLLFGMYTFSRNDTDTVFDAGSNLPGIIEKTNTREFVDYDEHTLVINRDGEDYEGAVYVGMYMYTGGALEAYGNELIITVKMAGHRTPYPEGSLGFLRVKHIPWNSFCEGGRTCAILAAIVGNNPEDITLWKRHADGRKELMDVPFHEYRYEYVFMKRFYLPNISRWEAGVYTYRGTDSTGNVVENDFRVSVFDL